MAAGSHAPASRAAELVKVPARYRRLLADPPLWLRLFAVATLASAVVSVTGDRGWAVGAFAAVVYGALALSMVRRPDPLEAWFQRHPVLDGALFGPLVFVGLAVLTSWSLWICLLLGLAGLLAGGAIGVRRRRLLAANHPG